MSLQIRLPQRLQNSFRTNFPDGNYADAVSIQPSILTSILWIGSLRACSDALTNDAAFLMRDMRDGTVVSEHRRQHRLHENRCLRRSVINRECRSIPRYFSIPNQIDLLHDWITSLC